MNVQALYLGNCGQSVKFHLHILLQILSLATFYNMHYTFNHPVFCSWYTKIECVSFPTLTRRHSARNIQTPTTTSVMFKERRNVGLQTMETDSVKGRQQKRSFDQYHSLL
jgi:hypothetical protein